MRGRQQFERYYGAVALLSGLLSIAPRSFRRWVYLLASGWKGALGLGVRYCCAKTLCAEIGRCVLLGPNVIVEGWGSLSIGDNVSIHAGSYVDATGGVTIGSDVSIAHGCSLLSTDHTWSDPTLPIRENPIRRMPLTLLDDVWIGCRSVLLSGVTIGSRSVVAAGAVVVHDVAPQSLVGGVPARLLKTLGAHSDG